MFIEPETDIASFFHRRRVQMSSFLTKITNVFVLYIRLIGCLWLEIFSPHLSVTRLNWKKDSLDLARSSIYLGWDHRVKKTKRE
jgi:hypothetical protein